MNAVLIAVVVFPSDGWLEVTRIVFGGCPADESNSELLEAGATYVGSTLIESRNQLREIVGHLVGLTAPPTRAAS